MLSLKTTKMERKKQETQQIQVLGYLMTGKTITPLQALKMFGCYRLSSVIHRLRRHLEIQTIPTESEGSRYATYKLSDAELLALETGEIKTPFDYIDLHKNN